MCSFSGAESRPLPTRWLPQVEYFAKDDRYSVIVLDNRGFGNTDTPSGYYS